MKIGPWRHYMGYYRGLRGSLTLSFLLSALQSLVLIPAAYWVRVIFDQALPHRDFNTLLGSSLGILFAFVISAGIAVGNRYLTLKITKQAVQKFREDLLEKIYRFSHSAFSRSDSSKVHSVVVQDSERVDVMSNALITQFFPAGIVCTGLLAWLVYLNISLVLILCGAVPLLLFTGKFLGKKVKGRVRDFHRDFERFSQGILFAVRRWDLTKIQAAEPWEIARQKKTIHALRDTSGSMAWMMTVYGMLQSTWVALFWVVILVFGGAKVIGGSLTLGDWLSFFVAASLLKEQLKSFLDSLPQLLAGHESLKSLYEIMDAEDLNSYGGNKKIGFSGRVRLKSVFFAYESEEILKGIDLQIDSGKTVALVGPSGAGKSTLINLILGFYRPKKGSIEAEGLSYDILDLSHLRHQMGVILQNPMLFSGTIAENIAYGAPEASFEEIQQAARSSLASEFVDSLPLAYNTLIGDDGFKLSGGQAQRLAIARALLRRPKLLILDEPTNHLDPALIEKLCKNLKELDSKTSILLVSHDERILNNADFICRIGDGRNLDRENAAGLDPLHPSGRLAATKF